MTGPWKETATISIAAGKGGTGKTLVATSLAVALNGAGSRGTELLDCDVEAPNAHLLLCPHIAHRQPVTVRVPQVSKPLCTHCGRCAEVCQFSAIAVIRDAVVTFPELCAGCGACAFICPADAIIEVEREVGVLDKGVTDEGIDFYQGRAHVGEQRSGPVIRAVKGQIHADAVTIIDAPPGTACPMQETIADTDYCILVTEPTPFGLSDLGAAVETCRQLRVPCGVIVNRDGIGNAPIGEYCAREGLPILLRIPHERQIAEAYSRGDTLVHAFPEWQAPLRRIHESIWRELLSRKEMTSHATW